MVLLLVVVDHAVMGRLMMPQGDVPANPGLGGSRLQSS